MAEERIAIFYLPTQPDSRGICPFQEYDDPRCWSKCNCEHCEEGITMQEAIEKMARAICRSGENECIGDCASCDLWKVGPEKDYAEAALNALLEQGK